MVMASVPTARMADLAPLEVLGQAITVTARFIKMVWADNFQDNIRVVVIQGAMRESGAIQEMEAIQEAEVIQEAAADFIPVVDVKKITSILICWSYSAISDTNVQIT